MVSSGTKVFRELQSYSVAFQKDHQGSDCEGALDYLVLLLRGSHWESQRTSQQKITDWSPLKWSELDSLELFPFPPSRP